MSNPWDLDRELNSEIVTNSLLDQFPEIQLKTVEILGSGWDYDAYLINNDLVVRFPRRAEVAKLLDREQEVLSFVRNRLAGLVATPEITIKGGACTHFPYPFFGHKLIRGVAADDPGVRLSPEFASELGAALTSIHSIPYSEETGKIFELENERCRERFEETFALFQRDSRIAQIVPEACLWLRERPEPPEKFGGQPRFIHYDICPDHIIVNPESGRLSGIIDWSDAAFGDPVWDFVALLAAHGNEFTSSVLGAYRIPLDTGFHRRLSFLARTSSLKWLIDAVSQNADVRKHIGWVENAFSFDA